MQATPPTPPATLATSHAGRTSATLSALRALSTAILHPTSYILHLTSYIKHVSTEATRTTMTTTAGTHVHTRAHTAARPHIRDGESPLAPLGTSKDNTKYYPEITSIYTKYEPGTTACITVNNRV